MTLVLTCLTQDNVLQVADRRVTLRDGTMKDDDTTKAVFYCGRFAVAFTGPDRMDGRPTAEWIAWCMKDAPGIDLAMRTIAERAEDLFRRNGLYKFAVIATGWATLRGAKPPEPFIGIVSNFRDGGKWQSSASDRMNLEGGFPLRRTLTPYYFLAAGQSLTRQEEASLHVRIAHAIKTDKAAMSLSQILGETIQTVARGSDERAQKVGRGMIIHLLPRTVALNESREVWLLCGLTPDANSFAYVSSEGRTDPLEGAVVTCNGTVLTNFKCGSLPRSAK